MPSQYVPRAAGFGVWVDSGEPSRFLRVEAAGIASRYDAGLRRTYRRLAFRKGAAIAKVAIARKLAIHLYIMLGDRIGYQEFCRRGSHDGMLGDRSLA